jgi:Dimethlysulfonioproprionate lyase
LVLMTIAARTLCHLLVEALHRASLTAQAETLGKAVDTATDGSAVGPQTSTAPLPYEVAARYYQAALGSALADSGVGLAKALSPLNKLLRWTQTDAYVRSPPHEHFLQRYAHATILGSMPDTAVIVDGSRTAAVGVLLLGPGNQYPHHQHYADEVYVPLTHATWSSGKDQPYVDRAPGITLHHESLLPHSMHTDDNSLLSLYLWTGDTTTSSWLC